MGKTNFECISTKSLYNAINALAFSEQQRLPLTAQATISWECIRGFDPSSLLKCQGSTLRELGRWLRRRGIRPAFIWCIENGRRLGLHTHISIHIPFSVFPFLQAKLERFIPGFEQNRRILEIAQDQGEQRPKYMWTATQRAGTCRYMLKGMDHRATLEVDGVTRNLGDLLGIEHRGVQGTVLFKRLGVSHSLGPVARRRAGYEDATHHDALRSVLHPPRRGIAA